MGRGGERVGLGVSGVDLVVELINNYYEEVDWS